MTDLINHPAHYKAGRLEVIDIIEAYGLGYHAGNALKYILRAGRKTIDPRDDLKKAIWYARRAREQLPPLVVRWHVAAGAPSPREVSTEFGLSLNLSLAVGRLLRPHLHTSDMPDLIAHLEAALGEVEIDGDWRDWPRAPTSPVTIALLSDEAAE